MSDYTIPSDNRELQHHCIHMFNCLNYTIPSDNRELQHSRNVMTESQNYTIPSDNRELQLVDSVRNIHKIIPYQVITGNYNKPPGGIIGRGLYHTK